jgi:uncharacterized protein YndB with AHSA1/START domain
MEIGEITVDGDARTIRFERHLPFPPAAVWSALTEPDQLAAWLTEANLEPREGGTVSFDFGEGGVCGGRVIVFDPPTVLEYEWDFPNEDRSVVRWELRATDGERATRLTLVHSLLRSDVASGYGAGWHAHLDQLQGHLQGMVPGWQERFDALLPRYSELAAGVN